MELQRKITVKGAGWDKNKIMAALLATAAVPAVTDATGKVITPAVEATYKDRAPLLKIVGVVNKTKPGTHDMGGGVVSEFIKLMGDFTAVNLSTGEMFRAPTCIVSDVVSAPIDQAIRDGADEVQFAVEVGAVYSPTSATGYTFYTKPLMEVKQTDKMTALLRLAGVDATPQLTNSATSSAEETKAEETAAPAPAPAAASSKRK